MASESSEISEQTTAQPQTQKVTSTEQGQAQRISILERLGNKIFGKRIGGMTDEQWVDSRSIIPSSQRGKYPKGELLNRVEELSKKRAEEEKKRRAPRNLTPESAK